MHLNVFAVTILIIIYRTSSQDLKDSITQNTVRRKQTLLPGAKSNLKCKEYSKYALESAGIYLPVATSSALRVSRCPITAITSIVGGTESNPKEFPHMALIGFEDTAFDEIHWDCGGSLISEKFVLTAGHCIYQDSYGAPKYVLLGDLVLNSTKDNAFPQKIRISQIIPHPNYTSKSHYNDIALIKLQKNAKLNTYVRPACLYTSSGLTKSHALATGWGRIGFFDDTSKALLKVLLEIFSHEECKKVYRNSGDSLSKGIEDETQICAGSHVDNKDTCLGDSGGPLQLNNNNEVHCTYKIIGVTSFGKLCGYANVPGVYTRVSAYIKWIEDTVWP